MTKAVIEKRLSTALRHVGRGAGRTVATNPLWNPRDALLKSLIGVIASSPELSRLVDSKVRIPGLGYGLSAKCLAQWLVRRGIETNGATAVAELFSFASSQTVRSLEVAALSGVTVTKCINITDKIRLEPWSSDTEDVGPRRGDVADDEFRHFFLELQPSAAIVVERRTAPAYTSDPAEGFPDSMTDTFHDIRRALVFVGPGCPQLRRQWSEPAPEVPRPTMPFGYGKPLHDVFPVGLKLKMHTPPAVQASDIELIRRYMSLPRELRDHLGLCLDRLSLAIGRYRPVDRAIELGIAVESLLTSDRDSDTPLSYLVRTRGAVLGGGDVADRERALELLKAVYLMRSKAVHTGALETQLRVKGGRRPVGELLSEGVDLALSLIRTVITRGALPAWDQVLLSANAYD